MGTQIHATENYRRIVELIRGRGDRRGERVPLLAFRRRQRGGSPRGDSARAGRPRLGPLAWPAPYRPYHPCYLPREWHFWWDFGGGRSATWAATTSTFLLGPRSPLPATVEAEGPPPHAESTPAWQHVRCRFDAGALPPVTLTWTHGNKRPALFAENDIPTWAWESS